MLSEQEIKVYRLFCQGYSNNEIANILFISSHTAKAHVSAILKKLHMKNRVMAAFFAGKQNLF